MKKHETPTPFIPTPTSDKASGMGAGRTYTFGPQSGRADSRCAAVAKAAQFHALGCLAPVAVAAKYLEDYYWEFRRNIRRFSQT